MLRHPKHKKQKLQRINFAHLPGPAHWTHLTTTYTYYQEDGKTAIRASQLVVLLLAVDESPKDGDKFEESGQEDFPLVDPEVLSMEPDAQAQKRKQVLGVRLNQVFFSDWLGAGRVSHWWLGFQNVRHSSMSCSGLKEGETIRPR